MRLECEDGLVRAELGTHLLEVSGAAEASIAQVGHRIGMPRQDPSAHELAPVNRVGTAKPVIVRIRIWIAGQSRIAIFWKTSIDGSHRLQAPSSCSARNAARIALTLSLSGRHRP